MVFSAMARSFVNIRADVTEAVTLAEAMRILSRDTGLNIIVLDLGLPDSVGLDTLTWTVEHSANIPIIIISSTDEYWSKIKAIDLGAQDYLVKGKYSGVELEKAIEYSIQRKQLDRALSNSYERTKKMLSGIVSAMAMAVEKKDPYVHGHQKRVAEIAVLVAQALGLNKEDIEGIEIAAMLHDLGKLGVPADLLSKPAPLKESEFMLIKEHSLIGYEILKPISFDYDVAGVVLQHHERLDGSGYPTGLKGSDIIMGAKIVGIADTIEAMMSSRPYRGAVGREKTIDEITKNKGKLYDPEVVVICLKMINNGLIEHCFIG
ncbi:MAG: HD domain-containing protein [Candidatus Omnitrophica bacterium]|nr:HD domain-containing protein [Candidatus Omnitrophota bacterium]